MTLNELETNHTSESFQFIIQIIADLWENYMFTQQDATDEEVDKVDLSDVGYFREWLDQEGLLAFTLYLPQSDSEMQRIIKYCEKETA